MTCQIKANIRKENSCKKQNVLKKVFQDSQEMEEAKD